MRPGHAQDAAADNAAVFHGREVRKVSEERGEGGKSAVGGESAADERLIQ